MAATTLTQSLFCACFSLLIFGGALVYFGDQRTWLLGLTAMGIMASAGFYAIISQQPIVRARRFKRWQVYIGLTLYCWC